MIFFLGRRHQCSYLDTGKTTDKIEMFPSPNKAGYDEKIYRYKIAECPGCGKKQLYDKEFVGDGEFVSYKNIIENEKHLDSFFVCWK